MAESTKKIKLKDKEISIYDNLLILVGHNGSGKTYLLGLLNEKSVHKKTFLGINQGNMIDVLSILKIDTQERLNEYIKHYFNDDLAKNLLERVKIDTLYNTKIDGDFAYRRLIYLSLLQDCNLKDVLIMIDEPELAAFPMVRKEICNILKDLQKNNTLVIATNLDNIVSALITDPLQIVYLEKNNELELKQIDIKTYEDTVYKFYHEDEYLLRRFSSSNNVDQGLKGIVEKKARSFIIQAIRNRIFDVFYSKVIVMGEGASEGILFEYIDDNAHPNWIVDKQVGFINGLGKSTLPLYFLFFNLLGIKVVCLYDYDNDNNPVHVAYREAFSRYQERKPKLFQCVALDPNLEEVLDIVPDYRLESIEKPVNIYNHTFKNTEADTKNLDNLIELISNLVEEVSSNG